MGGASHPDVVKPCEGMFPLLFFFFFSFSSFLLQ